MTQIQIGDFLLVRTDEGKLWINHVNGESMECNDDTESGLETVIEQFWKVHF